MSENTQMILVINLFFHIQYIKVWNLKKEISHFIKKVIFHHFKIKKYVKRLTTLPIL